MSAKSFKNNPAMQFITPAQPPPEETVSAPAPARAAPAVAGQASQTSSKKRRVVIPGHDPAFEAKSKRLNLLIRPSLFEQLSGIAAAKGISNNDLIHQVLEQAVISGSIQNI